ncbi:PREDICTED: E3 ubiquitin-protein ligase BOI-like [Ipomoea nil]|uniref:E3 ubiquitin-protein ligase BOI-like n=1 Tax=Ipomoea nil TaxID=35883 RepID=UPI000901EE94|nr:PREDICTED: E3 ubiquitin-protein ligase BOI-like [Ipomoea nil]
MAVEANSNLLLLPQEFSDFIPLGMENCRDFMSTKPRLAGYQSIFPFNRSRPVKTAVNGAAGNSVQQPSLQGKRSRDSLDLYNPSPVFPKNTQIAAVAGDDFLQSEIDKIVSHHTKKLRMEFEERQKQTARNLMASIGEGMVKKLREKDEEIQRMGKLNLALQERVKSLYVENQLWRDMAQTNEAAANSLRSNLEQVLAHVASDVSFPAAAAPVEEDAESCCGSSDHGRGDPEVSTAMPEWRTPVTDPQDSNNGAGAVGRICRRCGERESSVLLLPCRHLCLCTVCGSTLIRCCPVCNSNMNATVHVNMSS